MNRYLDCAAQPPTSPNIAPATQNECDDWSASHMKRHLQCAEQQESPSNFTKYCACHEKRLWWLIPISHETSSTMRGASGVVLQLHQILRLPRKMTLMIDPCHKWNVIYIARSSAGYRPTSPNIAPATKFWVQDVSGKSLNCFRQYKDDSNIIRWQNHHLAPAASETLLVASCRRILHGELQHFALWLSPKISQNAAPATKSDTPTAPNTAPATKSGSELPFSELLYS